MGTRGNDAFSNLMASVPGVDTSGFMRKTLNDMKGGRSTPSSKPTAPETSPSPSPRPSPQTSSKPCLSSSAPSPGDPFGVGNRQVFESSSVVSPPGGDGLGQKLELSGLDELSAWNKTPTTTGTSSATPLGDLFDGIPGAQPDMPQPVVQVQPGPASERDLVGLGDGDLVGNGFQGHSGPAAVESSTNDGGLDIFGYSSAAAAPPPPKEESWQGGSFGGQGVVEQDVTYYHSSTEEVTVPGLEAAFAEQDTPTVQETQPVPQGNGLHYSAVGNEDPTDQGLNIQKSSMQQETMEQMGTSAQDDSDSDVYYDEVLSHGSTVHSKKKTSRLSPHLSGAARNLLAKIARTSQGEEQEQPQKQTESGQQGSKGKSRFTKYRDNFHRKAVQYSKMGLDAVKQGLEVASDWVDKQMEERRKQGSGNQASGPHAIRDVDLISVAMDLEALSPMERSMVLDRMEPNMRQQVIELFHSQGVSLEEDSSQPDHPDQPHVGNDMSDLSSTHFAEDTPLSKGSGSRMSRPVSDPDISYQHLTRESVPLHEAGASTPNLRQTETDFVELNGDKELEGGVGGSNCDLLGLDDPPAPGPEPEPEPVAVSQSTMADPEDLDSFFGGIPSGSTSPKAQPQSQAGPSQPSAVDDIFGGSASSQAPGFSHGLSDDLMDMGAGGPSQCPTEYSDLYTGEQGTSDEPEIRRRLREKRIMDKHNKMQEALQEKLMKEQEAAEKQEVQYELKKLHLSKITAWKEGAQGNIRGLLTSLDKVLWEDSGWKSLTVGDVLESNQVKKAYRKANLLVHPDKVKQKNGTDEQIVLADMIFDVLKEAWAAFGN